MNETGPFGAQSLLDKYHCNINTGISNNRSGWVDPSHSSIKDTVDGSEVLHQPDMYVWNTVNNGIFGSQLVQHFFHQQ